MWHYYFRCKVPDSSSWKCVTLVLSHVRGPQRLHSVFCLIVHELDLSGSGVLGILNQFLQRRTKT